METLSFPRVACVPLPATALVRERIMQPLYRVPIRGSLVLFFTLSALYAFTGAGLGMWPT